MNELSEQERSEFAQKWHNMWVVICKRLYGHEDLSKAYIYCPYIPLQITPPLLKKVGNEWVRKTDEELQDENKKAKIV